MRLSICVSLFCFCLALDQTAAADTFPEVTASQPVVREVTDYGEFIGRTAAAQTVDVRSRVSGYLAKIDFKAGSAVQKGDLIFEIDSRLYEADLEQHAAQLHMAEARLKRLAADIERSKMLVARGAIGRDELDRTEADRGEAQAAIQVAQTGLESAKCQLDSTKIRSPISGKIGLLTVDVGNLVMAGTTSLATIVSTDPVYVCFDVDERTALQLRRNAPEGRENEGGKSALPVACGLADETGYPRQGTVDVVNNIIDPATGVLHMRTVLPNPAGLIIPGMSVRVRLAVNKPYKAVLVPELAIMSDQGNKQVFVVTQANVIELRPVKLGPLQDGLRVISEGLAVEDNVVVRGTNRVRPGMTVTVKKAESPEQD